MGEEAAPAFASGTIVEMRRYVRESPPAGYWLQPGSTMGNFVTLMTHEFENNIVNRICFLLSQTGGTHPGSGATEAGGRSMVLSVELVGLIWPGATKERREIDRRLEL